MTKHKIQIIVYRYKSEIIVLSVVDTLEQVSEISRILYKDDNTMKVEVYDSKGQLVEEFKSPF